MNHNDQLKAIEAIRMVAPRGLTLTPITDKYHHFAVEIEYGAASETVVLEGYSNLYCVKRIMNSYPVEAALE